MMPSVDAYQGPPMSAINHAHLSFGGFDLSSPAQIMTSIRTPAFINALSADWKVGYELWKVLEVELKKALTDSRNKHLPPNSGGYNRYQDRQNQKTNGNRDIVKAPLKVASVDNSKIPMQYSSNQAQTAEQISLEDEDVKTFLSIITNTRCNIKNDITSKAHTQYLAMLVNHNQDLCIPDGGADSHVGGKTWLPLTPLSGPNVKFANVTGFDEEEAKKFGCPLCQQYSKQPTQMERKSW